MSIILLFPYYSLTSAPNKYITQNALQNCHQAIKCGHIQVATMATDRSLSHHCIIYIDVDTDADSKKIRSF